MKLYLTDGKHWTGTQADAKAAGATFAQIEVPVDKPGLLGFLQRLQDKITELRAKREGEGPAPTPTATFCAECSEPQLDTPSGVTCVNGHGGAASVDTPLAAIAAKPLKVPVLSPLTTVRDWTTEIEGLDKQQLVKVLSAALGRFGEVAGLHGWSAFSKEVYAWSPGSRSIEQAMGMLMLAAFNHFGEGKSE